ncbi:MAG: hypothetical protein ACK2T3_15180 [Candidatus Promineifilaceae bacterium]|jgi:hypothetical protein
MAADAKYSIEFDSSINRMKITISSSRKWRYLSLFSALLIAWIIMFVAIMVYLLGAFSPSILITLLLLFWLVIWLFFGRYLWRRWLFFAASRELLFIDDEQLVYRRPVSLLGHTAAYDLAHVTPFYFSDVHNCLAFDYAYLHVYFGYDLPRESAEALIAEVNQQWFPDMMPADDAEA